VTRTPRKDNLDGMEMLDRGEKGRRLSDCRKTTKDDKERIVKQRSFSKKKFAVLTDPQFGGKDLALVDEKVWFPYILDSGAFATVVPK